MFIEKNRRQKIKIILRMVNIATFKIPVYIMYGKSYRAATKMILMGVNSEYWSFLKWKGHTLLIYICFLRTVRNNLEYSPEGLIFYGFNIQLCSTFHTSLYTFIERYPTQPKCMTIPSPFKKFFRLPTFQFFIYF